MNSFLENVNFMRKKTRAILVTFIKLTFQDYSNPQLSNSSKNSSSINTSLEKKKTKTFDGMQNLKGMRCRTLKKILKIQSIQQWKDLASLLLLKRLIGIVLCLASSHR